MTEFLLVSKKKFEEFESLIARLSELHSELSASAGTALLPGSPTENPVEADDEFKDDEDSVFRITTEEIDRMKVNGKYLIRRGAVSYADVVVIEVKEREFTGDHAAGVIEPLIHSKSQRWRESMRRALENDWRFRRIRRSGGDWFLRTAEVEILGNEDEEDSVRVLDQEAPEAKESESWPWDEEDELPF